MANQQAAALARILSNVGKYSVLLGVGGSILQTSLYTGACMGLKLAICLAEYMMDVWMMCFAFVWHAPSHVLHVLIVVQWMAENEQ